MREKLRFLGMDVHAETIAAGQCAQRPMFTELKISPINVAGSGIELSDLAPTGTRKNHVPGHRHSPDRCRLALRLLGTNLETSPGFGRGLS